MSVTWQNVKDLFYETVGDTETAQTFFDEATVTAYADEAMREAAHQTRYSDYFEQQVTIAQTPLVTLTTSRYAQVWRVEVDNLKMLPATTARARRADRGWAERQGTPRFYMLDEYQADAEASGIRLFPTPNEDDLLVTVYAYTIQAAINDAAPTQVLNLPEWFAYSLLFGMLARAYAADTEMRSFEKADFYRAIWNDAVMRLRARSFGRLNKRWAFKAQGHRAGVRLLDILPENIPEPL